MKNKTPDQIEKFLKDKDSPSQKIGYKPDNKFRKIKNDSKT